METEETADPEQLFIMFPAGVSLGLIMCDWVWALWDLQEYSSNVVFL